MKKGLLSPSCSPAPPKTFYSGLYGGSPSSDDGHVIPPDRQGTDMTGLGSEHPSAPAASEKSFSHEASPAPGSFASSGPHTAPPTDSTPTE